MLGVHVLTVLVFSLERKWMKMSVCTIGTSSQMNWEHYMAKNWKAAEITAGMNVMEKTVILPLTVKLWSKEKEKAMFHAAHLKITRQCFFFLGVFLNECPPSAGMTQESWGRHAFWKMHPSAYALKSVEGMEVQTVIFWDADNESTCKLFIIVSNGGEHGCKSLKPDRYICLVIYSYYWK